MPDDNPTIPIGMTPEDLERIKTERPTFIIQSKYLKPVFHTATEVAQMGEHIFGQRRHGVVRFPDAPL